MIRGDNIALNNYAPKLMDKLLSLGYFRSGKSMFHSPVTFIEGVPNSTIRTRLSLDNHILSKSSRKLLAKNNRKFRHELVELELSKEVKDLYAIYKEECFKGNLNGELSEWLEGSKNNQIFDSRMCKFYDGDTLVAVSFVDMGHESMASIMGIYHPEYKKYSMGIYSMLVEVEYAKEKGLAYYYPGYILSASPRFEYKKKVGNLSYKSFNSMKWKSLDELDHDNFFVEKSLAKLNEAKDCLLELQIESEIFAYPLFTWSTYPVDASLLEQYFFLRIKVDLFDTLHIIVVYDILQAGFNINLVNTIGKMSNTWQEFKNFYPEDGNWLDTVLVQSTSRLEKDVKSLPVLIITMLKSIRNKIKLDEI